MLTIQLHMRRTECAVTIAKESARGHCEQAGVYGTVVHSEGILEVWEGGRERV